MSSGRNLATVIAAGLLVFSVAAIGLTSGSNQQLSTLTGAELALAVGQSNCMGGNVLQLGATVCKMPARPSCTAQPACCQSNYEGNPCPGYTQNVPIEEDGIWDPNPIACQSAIGSSCKCVAGSCQSGGIVRKTCQGTDYFPTLRC